MNQTDQNLSFVSSVAVGRSGCVVIPAKCRESLGIEAGHRLLLFFDEKQEALVLTTVSQYLPQACRADDGTDTTESQTTPC